MQRVPRDAFAVSATTRPRARHLAVGVLLAVAVALIVAHVLASDSAFGTWTYIGFGTGASAVAWAGARWSGFGASTTLIASGITLSTIGDVIWEYLTLGDAGPATSLADAAWLAAYLAIGVALLGVARSRGGLRVDRDGIVDVVVVFLVTMVVQWELTLQAIVTDATVSVPVRVVWGLYPTFDAVLLALVLRAVVAGRLLGRSALLLAGGATFWLMSDFAYSLVAGEGDFTVWMEVGWLLGAMFFAGAAWRRSSPVPSGVEATSVGSYSGVMVALVPLAVPSGIAVVEYSRGATWNPYLLYVTTLSLLALAFTRAARLLRAEKTLRATLRSQERFATALAANSSDAVAVLDTDGTLLHAAPRLAELIGHPGTATIGQDAFHAIASEDADSAREVFARCVNRPGQTFAIDLRVRNGGGQTQWLSARMVNLVDDPDVAGVVVNLHDITARKNVEAALTHQAFHDGLTDLANRALFIDRVEHTLHRNARTAAGTVVLFLDLDGFKSVNDNLGHAAGDVLLKEVARRLVEAVGSGDTVARLGGDEFAILIEQSAHPLVEAEIVAERILAALSTPIVLSAQAVTVSASVGIAISNVGVTATALLRDADVAMYRAKSSGKACWFVYDAEMRTVAAELLHLESDLPGAVAGDQLRLVYQPIVLLDTGRIVGFEALLRWHHPTLGVVAPDRFIPLAEASGQIVGIGKWVLDEACATAVRWQRTYPERARLSMTVNLSARQIASPHLVGHVTGALAASGLAPELLVLEMTETTLIQDTETAAARLHELHNLGVRMAIDDFGTGYSSLSYLRQFPIDILKIDRSFTSMIVEPGDMPPIVRGLLELGRTLGLRTLAEGVELEVQRDMLREHDCEFAQGYLFSRPLEPLDAELLLIQTSSAIPAALPRPVTPASSTPAA